MAETIDVWTAIKDYSGEKKALAMATCLDGPAFECYACMSDDEQKKPEKIATQLKQEFVKAEGDRETAIHERSWRISESPPAFAQEVARLATLAYPGFEQVALDTIVRDCFLPTNLRVLLRRDP